MHLHADHYLGIHFYLFGLGCKRLDNCQSFHRHHHYRDLDLDYHMDLRVQMVLHSSNFLHQYAHHSHHLCYYISLHSEYRQVYKHFPHLWYHHSYYRVHHRLLEKTLLLHGRYSASFLIHTSDIKQNKLIFHFHYRVLFLLRYTHR
jgi:hypothetical protein